MNSQSKILQGVSMGYHQCEKCCWWLANSRSTSWPNVLLLSRCLLKPKTLGALLSNEYFCWRNDCRVLLLCMNSLCQNCLWPWVKGLSCFICLGFHITAWWFAVWEFDEKDENFPLKKIVRKYKCMPFIHGLPGKELLLWWHTISSALVDIQNLKKWFTVNTSVQSIKEVCTSVASCSLIPGSWTS